MERLSYHRRGILLAALTALAVGGSPALATAQVPQVIGYTGFLSDDDGPVDREVEVLVSIFDTAVSGAGGSALWGERHESVDVVGGSFTIALGSATRFPSDLFASDQLYLELTIDGETLSPRARLRSVPYALRAADADRARTLDGFAATDFQRAFAVDCPDEAFVESISREGVVTCGVPPGLSSAEIDALLEEAGVLTGDSPIAWTQLDAVPEGFADGTDDTLTEDEVDAFVANNGFASEGGDVAWDQLVGVPEGFADGVDNDSPLTEEEILSTVGEGGFLHADDDIPWSSLSSVPPGFADGEDAVLTEEQVDAFVADNGYVHASDEIPWSSLSSVPPGFADGEDNVLTEAQVDDFVSDNGFARLASLARGCPPGEVVVGFDGTGRPECAPDANTTYDGGDFAVSDVSCSPGQVVTGIGADGRPTCAPDEDTTYDGADFALSDRSCGPGNVVTGIGPTGQPTCASDATSSGASVQVAGGDNCSTWTAYYNDWDQYFAFTCPDDQVLIGISSYHDNGKEDRRFRFRCCTLTVR